MRRRHAVLVLTVAVGLGFAGCGDDREDGGGADAGASSPTTTETGAPSSSTETTTAGGETSTTTTTTDGSSSASSVPEDDLPGEAVDIYPYEGATVGVVGVAADDTLNVRSGPGTDFEVVTELAPLASDAVATGRNRTLDDDSLWVELDAGVSTGWVNGLYLAELGQTTDVTAEVGETLGGETMVAVGEAVAAARAPAEEGPPPTVTVVDGPTVGDVGEVTVDMVGLADDAVKGERLHVVAAPDASGEGFTVTTVEATLLCARGVTADGRCT